MRQFQAAVFALSKLAAVLSAVLLVAMVAHIVIEIVLRSFFSTSTFVLDEFVGYGVAAMTFLSLAYALEEGSLIRVNVVLSRLRGRARRGVEIVSVLATLGLTCFVAYYFWRDLSRNFTRGAVSESIAEVPLWIPQALVFAGLALFAIQLFAYFLRLASGGKAIAAKETLE